MIRIQFLRQNAPWLSAGMLLAFTSSFGQTFFISIFAGEIRAEFGLSHGQWGGIYALGTLASAVVMIWAGGLADHFRARTLGAFVLTGLAAACLFMAIVPGPIALLLTIFALRFTGQGMSTHISNVAMARWFVAARGKAISIASLGFGIGEAILPLTFVALLAMFNWRVLWGLNAVLVLMAIPALLLLLRRERTPKSIANAENSTGMQGRHWTRKDVLRHRLFWIILPSILAPACFGTAFFFQQVHLAADKGWAHLSLVALFPIYTAVGALSMLVAGWAVDRFGSARLMPFFQLPMAIGFLILGQAQSLTLAAVSLAFMAITIGANAPIPASFLAEFYGTRHLGAIKALAVAAMVLGSAIGPGLTGWLIDRGLSFSDQTPAIAFVFVLVSGLLWLGVGRSAKDLPVAA